MTEDLPLHDLVCTDVDLVELAVAVLVGVVAVLRPGEASLVGRGGALIAARVDGGAPGALAVVQQGVGEGRPAVVLKLAEQRIDARQVAEMYKAEEYTKLAIRAHEQNDDFEFETYMVVAKQMARVAARELFPDDGE